MVANSGMKYRSKILLERIRGIVLDFIFYSVAI